MSDRLKDRKLVVLGAAGGIGSACVDLFVKEGAQVLASDLGETPGELLKNIRINGYQQADCTSAAAIERLFAQARKLFGSIDGMLYCAGIGSTMGFVDTTESHWDQVMSTNLKGAFLASQQAVACMDPEKGGSIVLIASQKALCGSTGSLAYNAAKGAMVIMSRSMALELAARHIRVNCICPGPVNTQMLHRDMNSLPNSEEAWRRLAQTNPQNRIGNPYEIAPGAVYVMSEEASFMTGNEIVIDGGNIAGVANF